MAAVVTAAGTASVQGVQPAAEPPLDLFLLAGQSNMAGRGVVEVDDLKIHPRVWMLDRANRWAPAIEPMHFDKPIAGVGPGRAFGIAIAEADPTARVGLVPVAVGGSPIAAWVSGATHDQTGAKPFDDAVVRIRAAKRHGAFRAILWHQGESDANEAAAPAYAGGLRAVIERLRAEAGDPRLPVLIGQLGRFPAAPWTAWHLQVDAAHRRLVAEVPRVAFVSSEGLTDKGDALHFDAASARTLGRRYADAYRALTR